MPIGVAGRPRKHTHGDLTQCGGDDVERERGVAVAARESGNRRPGVEQDVLHREPEHGHAELGGARDGGDLGGGSGCRCQRDRYGRPRPDAFDGGVGRVSTKDIEHAGTGDDPCRAVAGDIESGKGLPLSVQGVVALGVRTVSGPGPPTRRHNGPVGAGNGLPGLPTQVRLAEGLPLAGPRIEALAPVSVDGDDPVDGVDAHTANLAMLVDGLGPLRPGVGLRVVDLDLSGGCPARIHPPDHPDPAQGIGGRPGCPAGQGEIRGCSPHLCLRIIALNRGEPLGIGICAADGVDPARVVRGDGDTTTSRLELGRQDGPLLPVRCGFVKYQCRADSGVAGQVLATPRYVNLAVQSHCGIRAIEPVRHRGRQLPRSTARRVVVLDGDDG